MVQQFKWDKQNHCSDTDFTDNSSRSKTHERCREPYGLIYRETGGDNASQTLKKITAHKLKQWNSFSLKCNDEDKQMNVGGIK